MLGAARRLTWRARTHTHTLARTHPFRGESLALVHRPYISEGLALVLLPPRILLRLLLRLFVIDGGLIR